ncbi:MAG: RICIN domain-containing protein [Muribaculaceae bacterium]|nr:RICIN domain-containing protein [Muribaculaceae bacterium]
MKKYLLTISAAACAAAAAAQVPSAWVPSAPVVTADRNVTFDINATGTHLPILWGFDTAWNDRANMLRGLRHAGCETVGVARVSFQPWDVITEKGKLPASLQRNLEARLANVALAGKKVDIALNLDGGEPTIKEVYGYLDENDNYIGDKEAVAEAYARLIDATAAAVEEAGYRVVSAAPFNEPDYFWNGTPIEVFDLINRRLKNYDEYPRFRDIRISGGNTLNCDQALPWYETLSEHLDEGNTHQLAGDFDHYAEFFTRVRQDGKYATADELHNVMEAMVGVEYGMQTGIWWGTAEQARGEFMKASSGERLGYAENRTAWSAASVYRAPSGKLQGFAGCSERQALPSSFNFVSLDGPVFIDGHGPVREYMLSLPGDPHGEYASALQRNAETVINITNGEDVQPLISGSYAIVNASASNTVIGGKGGTTANGTDIVAQAYTASPCQHWTVAAIPEDTVGDFSYHFIRNTASGQALDDNNWNIEVGGKVIAYAPSSNAVQQWALEYDGDGWFHIRNKQSALYLDAQGGAEGTLIVQNERADTPSQRWRFLPEGAPLHFNAPDAPSNLTATRLSASVLLNWDAAPEGISFNVLRAGADGEFITIARGLAEPAFLDNSIEGEATHIYKVVAFDHSGNRSAASSATECGVSTADALIARYPLSGNADDTEENAMHLKGSRTPSFDAGRTEGTRSLSVKRGQFLQFPYSLFQRDRFTLAMWVNPSVNTGGAPIFITGSDNDHHLLLCGSKDGQCALLARNGDAEASLTAEALEVSQWSHVAVTLDGTDAALYINGRLAASGNLGEALPCRRTLSYIGRDMQESKQTFTGLMQEIQIYNNPLDAAGIAAAMNGDDAGVSGVSADSRIAVATEYHNLQGQRIPAPSKGTVTIVRTIFSDGTSAVSKVSR